MSYNDLKTSAKKSKKCPNAQGINNAFYDFICTESGVFGVPLSLLWQKDSKCAKDGDLNVPKVFKDVSIFIAVLFLIFMKYRNNF